MRWFALILCSVCCSCVQAQPATQPADPVLYLRGAIGGGNFTDTSDDPLSDVGHVLQGRVGICFPSGFTLGAVGFLQEQFLFDGDTHQVELLGLDIGYRLILLSTPKGGFQLRANASAGPSIVRARRIRREPRPSRAEKKTLYGTFAQASAEVVFLDVISLHGGVLGNFNSFLPSYGIGVGLGLDVPLGTR